MSDSLTGKPKQEVCPDCGEPYYIEGLGHIKHLKCKSSCQTCQGIGTVCNSMGPTYKPCSTCVGTGQAPQSNGKHVAVEREGEHRRVIVYPKPPQDSTDELNNFIREWQPFDDLRDRAAYRDALKALLAAERHRYAIEVLVELKNKCTDMSDHSSARWGIFEEDIEAAITAQQQAMEGGKDE